MTIAEKQTNDDVLDKEIEQEHKEAEARKSKTNVEVGFAPKDEQEEFCKKINDNNLFPIETTLTIKLVDFVDISEFNSQPIVGGEYRKKLFEFIENHKQFNPEVSKKIRSLLKESGLFMTFFKVVGGEFNSIKSSMYTLKESLLHGYSDCLEKILESISPEY